MSPAFGQGDDGTLEPLVDAVDRSARAGKPFRLASVTDFEWDRAQVFGPYTPIEVIPRELRIEIVALARSRDDREAARTTDCLEDHS